MVSRKVEIKKLADLRRRTLDAVMESLEDMLSDIWSSICTAQGWCPGCAVDGLNCPHCGGTAVHRDIMRQTS